MDLTKPLSSFENSHGIISMGLDSINIQLVYCVNRITHYGWFIRIALGLGLGLGSR